MRRLNPDKLVVRMEHDASPRGSFLPRRYTLTHSDRTGMLFLTVKAQFDWDQISGWYTRFVRDEVLGEWVQDEDSHELHVHCHVSGGIVLGTAAWRERIFRHELPLVLEAMRYGDGALFRAQPELDQAPVWVHFHVRQRASDRPERWGALGDYR